jgi:hypothetical protein
MSRLARRNKTRRIKRLKKSGKPIFVTNNLYGSYRKLMDALLKRPVTITWNGHRIG